jgi:hypothetical protein
MRKKAFPLQLVWVLAAIALSNVGCSTPDTSGRNRVIEAALNQAFGIIGIPTGPQLRVTDGVLAFLKKAESAGLVRVREIPQGYWDSFLNRTQGMGRPFEVVGTEKLNGVALNPYFGGEPGDDPNVVLRVRVSEAKMDRILTDEEYKGPLATPGEKHRLILGTFKNIPTAAATVVGRDVAKQEEYLARFRCVVKYSEFKKAWSLVALDVGSTDPEQWYTSNVK